jgi:hypothetical protein
MPLKPILFNQFSLKLRAGRQSLSDDPQFYQYNKIGGMRNIEGSTKEIVIKGNSTTFAQMNWFMPLQVKIFNGKIGVLRCTIE